MVNPVVANPLWTNFNYNNYAMPTELRGGSSTPYNFSTSVFSPAALAGNTATVKQASINPFGNYSSIGMSGMFENIGSLCSFTDSFLADTKPQIEQAKAYNDQMWAQSFATAQQASSDRDQLKSLGFDAATIEKVIKAGGIQASGILNNTNTNGQQDLLAQLAQSLGLGGTVVTGANAGNDQLAQLLQTLGLGGAVAPAAPTQTDQLTQLLQTLGLGGAAAPAAPTQNDELSSLLALLGLSAPVAAPAPAQNDELSSLLALLGLSAPVAAPVPAANNDLNSLLALLGLGGTTATQTNKANTAPAPTYYDDDGGDAAFWAYIDSKAAQSKQTQTQPQNDNTLLLQLLGLLTNQ